MTAFIRYEKKNEKKLDVITVTKNGSIGFPKYFHGKHHLDPYKFVVIHYNPDQKEIALKFLTEGSDKTDFKLVHSKEGYGASIMARAFFNSFELKPETYSDKYEYEKKNLDDIGEAFVFKLKPKVTTEASSVVPQTS